MEERRFAFVKNLPIDFQPLECPPKRVLGTLFEHAFTAAGLPEEGRYLQFNLAITPPLNDKAPDQIGRCSRFAKYRDYSPNEIRRVAPALDPASSAIWVEWNRTKLKIVGIVDFGTSWHEAMLGTGFVYSAPQCLLTRVTRQGLIKVYHSGTHIASLIDGQIAGWGRKYVGALTSYVADSTKGMAGNFTRPTINRKRELPEAEAFEKISLWNTYAGIANLMSARGHGGALIIAPCDSGELSGVLRMKYKMDSDRLRSSYISFVNQHHKLIDLDSATRKRPPASMKRVRDLVRQLLLDRADFDELCGNMARAIKWVADLAGCDGAIMLSRELHLRGFGVEIRAELNDSIKVFESVDDRLGKLDALDVEQFGMRHRSAIKLVSQCPDLLILVVSQDGPVSAVWSPTKGHIHVSKNVDLVGLTTTN